MAELANWDDVFASVEEAKAGPKPTPKEPQSWDDVDTAIKEVESGFNPDYLKELRTAEAVAQTVVSAPPLGAAEWAVASQVSPEYQRAALERSAELFKKRGPMKGRGAAMRTAVAAVQGGIDMAMPVAEFFAPDELQITPEQEQFRQALRDVREGNDPSLSEGWVASTIQQAARMAPPMLMMGSAGRATGAVGTSLGLGAKGATAAQGLGVAAAAYPMASDQSYRSLIAEGVDPEIAAPVSRVSGVLEGAIEMLNLDPFKVQPGVLKGTVRQIVTEAARRLGVQAGRIGLEAFEEGSQAFTREAVAEAARAIDEKVPNKGLGQAFAAAAEDGLGSIGPLAVVMGPGMIASAVGTARNTAARPGQYQEAIKRRDYERFRRELAQSPPPTPTAVETTAEDSPGARLARLQEMRAKGFISAEDAAKEGLGGKNRKERLASWDAEIERLAKETAAAETQPTPLPEDIPTVGNTPQESVLPAQPATPPAATQPGATPTLPNPATPQADEPPEQQSAISFLKEKFPDDPRVDEAMLKYGAEEVARNYGWKPPTVTPEEKLRGAIGQMLFDARKENEGFKIPPMTLEDVEGEVELLEEKLKRGKKLSKDDIRTLRQRSGASNNVNEAIENDPEAFIRELRKQVDAIKGKPSTAGPSEETGTKPTASPTVSPDAPAKPETSMGETAGEKQPSEARADKPKFKFGQVIPAEEADRVVSELRAGDERSKNKGQGRVSEGIKEPLVVSTVPLSEFDTPDPDYETYMKFLESSTDPARVESYAKQKIDTPVFVTQARDTGQLIAADGGHRIVAAAKRGDKEVLALVPVAVHERLHPTESKGTVPPTPAPVESKWQAETRSKLEAVPAFKDAKIETDEKAGTARVTRADGLATTVHFDADERLAKAAKKIGRKQIYGLYFRKNGETEGRIYIHSKANHANILNHEVMHWLEDAGVVTKEEVEQYGGTEAIAEKYGKWASLKQRKKDSFFQRIYDALEPLFSSQRRFFEEVGSRQADTQKKPSYSEQLQKNYIKQKRALTKAQGTGDPREILKAAEQGLASFEQFGEPDDWSRWVRAKEDAEQAIKRADTAPVPQQPKGGGPTTTAEQVPPLPQKSLPQEKKPSVERIDDWRKAVSESIESDPVRASSIMRRVASRTDSDAEAGEILDFLQKRDGYAERSNVAWDLVNNPRLSEAIRTRARDWYDKNGLSKPSADQVNVDSGAESKAPAEDEFTAAVNAAFDERFGEGKATEETKPTKAPKKLQGKKDQQAQPEKKTLTEKARERKERTSAAKAEKLAKFKELLKQKQILKAIYDPKAEGKADAELLIATVELTAAAIDDGVSTFAEYVAWIAENIGASATRQIAPYLEAGWARLGTYDRFRGKIDKAGKVSDILTEVSDEIDTGSTRDSGSATDARPEDLGAGETEAGGITDGGRPEEAGDGSGGGLAGDGGRTEVAGDESPGGTERGDEGIRLPAGPGGNYRIGADERVGSGAGRGFSAKARFTENAKAIRLLKTLEEEGRKATAEEQGVLVKYVGWGGLKQAFGRGKLVDGKTVYHPIKGYESEFAELKDLLTDEEWQSAKKSITNAHYTDPSVIRGMWQGLEALGFKGGKIVEPSAGTGLFFGLIPQSILNNPSTRLAATEIDSISGRIAQQLYQGADIRVHGFEELNLADNSVDLFISNVPFGQNQLSDRKDRSIKADAIHNFFFNKAIKKTRPGGLVAFITSRYSMDEKDASTREFWDKSGANLVGAVRLPGGAFKGIANTDVVTDIIILQKREDSAEPVHAAPWKKRKNVPQTGYLELVPRPDGQPGKIKVRNEGDTAFPVNEYFEAHPEHVVGELAWTGTMQKTTENQVNVEPPAGSISDKVNEIISGLPVDKDGLSYTTAMTEEFDSADLDAIKAGDWKEDHLRVEGDRVYLNDFGNRIEVPMPYGRHKKEGDKIVEIAPDPKGAARTTAIIKVFNAAERLIAMQPTNAPDEQIEAARRELNKVYDAVVKEYGPLSSGRNATFARMSLTVASRVFSLEEYDPNTDTAQKAAIFRERTQRPHSFPTKADTAQDALTISLSQVGRLDPEHVSGLLGRPVDSTMEELGDLVFKNHTGDWELAQSYLSGNVRQKLSEAKALAENNDEYHRNVAALEAVQPKDLSPSQIEVRLNSPWIPTEVYEQFIEHLLRRPVKVSRSAAAGKWFITPESRARNDQLETLDWGIARMPALDIITKSLNRGDLRVYDPDGQGGRVVNQDDTTQVASKLEKIKAEFQRWLWSDHARADSLTDLYNREINNMHQEPRDGSHLTFPGMSEDVRAKLDKHQVNAVWRYLTSGNMLLAHVVGAGKSWIMTAAAMEQKRISGNPSFKTMIAVPNHLVTSGQFVKEILEAYPSAKVLAATPDSLSGIGRRSFLKKIATGNYDIVVIAHSSFGKIPLNPENEMEFIQKQIDDLETEVRTARADSDRSYEAELQAMIDNLRDKLAKISSDMKRDELSTYFDDLNIDSLFVDEAHEFKNLAFRTKMSRVPGVNPSGSNMAFDMWMKTTYFNKATNEKKLMFATGTPIANAIAEMYTMQRYLQPSALERLGLQQFDNWAASFADEVTKPEIDPAGGGMRMHSRLSQYINMPELSAIFRQVADVQTADMLVDVLKRPLIEGDGPQAIKAERNAILEEIIEGLQERAQRVRSGVVDKSEDNMLNIVTDGRKAATDIRLIDPTYPDLKGSKVNLAVESIHRIWEDTSDKKLTQVVWLDVTSPSTDYPLNLYHEIVDKLAALGIPREEIAIMHDYNEKTKAQLFRSMNKGDIRILLGSTAVMGTGVNVQRRLIASHHLDVPWRPDQLEQRDGRILRRGNTNKKVKIIRYISKGSFDAFMWDKIEQKTSFIRAAMSGASDRVLDASEAEDMSAAEMKAAAADDPNLIRYVTVQAEVNKLESEQRGFLDQQSQIRRGIASAHSNVEYYTKRAADFAALIKIHETVANDLPEGEIRGSIDGVKGTFSDPKEFADALTTALVNAPSGSNARGKVVVFGYNGLMGQVSQPPKSDPDDFEASGWLGNRDTNVDLYLGVSPAGNITRLNNAVAKIKERPDVHRETVEQNRLKIPALEKRIQAEWPDAKKLSDLREEQTQLASLVQAGKGDEHKKAVAGKLNQMTGRAVIVSPDTGRYLFKDVKFANTDSKNAAQNEAPAVVPANVVDAAEGELAAERSREREARLRKLRDVAEVYEWDRSINPRPSKKPARSRKRSDDGGAALSVAPNVVQRTRVGSGTPQQSSRANFSETNGETKAGKRLLDRMKRDSVSRKIGPRSIMNYLYDVVRSASITGKSQLSRRNPGHYKPREHLVRSRTGASGVIDTHEAGHALSAILRDKDKRILKKYEPDLIALTQMPNSMASGQTAEEGIAEFVRRYIVDYQSLPKALVDDLEADIAKIDPELLAGLKDTNRLWQQFLARPLQERLDASKNDRQPRKIGRGFRDAVYRSLYNIIGGDVAIHKVRRELERPLFQFSQALGREFRDKATDTQADIDNAYQSVIRVPVETQRAIFGDSRSKDQGVSIIAFGDNMFSPDAIQYLRDGGFKVPDEFKHGERVYLTNQSFEQIREKLGNDWDSFENYGQLRASLERADKKGHQSAWMHENVSMAEAAQAIADMESANPAWIDHFDEVREFFDGLLLVATLSGEYTPEEAVKIRNAWDSYWPLLRQVTPEENSRVGRGGPDPSAGVHRAFGSALPLRNLLEAVELRTKAAMQAYYTNRMMLAMRKYSDTLHSLKDAPFDIRKAGARLMVPLRMDMKKVASLSPIEQAQMILEYMNKQMQDEADANGDVLDPDDLLTLENIDISMPWRPIFRATRPGAIQVIGLTENGERKYYQVTDPLVFDLFSNSGSMSRYATWLARFFAKGIGPWKRALTQNLAFAIRNLPRDSVTALTMGESEKSFVPGAFLAYGIVGRLNGSLGQDAPARAELFSRTLESLHQPRHKKVWDNFVEAATEGIVIPGYMDMNFYDRVSEAPGQLSALALWPVTMFNWATGGRYISQMSEELQREGAFLEARGRGRSYEYAQRQYDQISGNFSQRQPNHATATFIRSAGFLNPGLQIMWGQMKRWADPDPRAQKLYLAKLPALAAWFAVSSAINVALVYALFGDDEEKLDEVLNDMRERPDYEKDTTMSVMGTVRLPFEYGLSGAVSSFAWNATQDALLGGSNETVPTRLKAFLARATQIPGPTDAIHPYLKTAIELQMGEAGYSMYRNDSIVPEQLIVQYPANPELRAYDDTPVLFKQIGEMARVSPLKVEYAIGSLFTGTASDLIALGGKIAGGKSLSAKDFPVVSRLMQRESTGFRSQSVRELRKAHQEVEAMGVKISKMNDAPQELLAQYAKLHDASLAYDVVSSMYEDVQAEVDAADTDRSAVAKVERQMTRFARQFLNYRAGKAPEPPQLKARKYEYHGQQAYDATGSPESKTGLESQNKAIAMLNLSGLTLVEAKKAMIDYWEATNTTKNAKGETIPGSATEIKNGQPVLKDAVRNRLSKLKQLLKAD